MDRCTVLESMYEVIKESTEWCLDSEDKVYGNYIDGVISVTEKILEKIKLEEDKMLNSMKNVLKVSPTNLDDYTTICGCRD